MSSIKVSVQGQGAWWSVSRMDFLFVVCLVTV